MRNKKFSLSMNGNDDIRNLEDLKDNFDINAIVEYFKNGDLLTWLDDRYYDDEADAVNALEDDDPDLKEKLCSIFGVEYEDDECRKERLEKLKQYTDDDEILDKVDLVAFDQEELADLLDEGKDTVYLCENKFRIPLRQTNITYTGVGKSEAIIKSKEPVDFDKLGIKFVDIRVNDQNKNPLVKNAEQAVEEKDYTKAIELYKKAVSQKDNKDEAILNIGERYTDGEAVRKDLDFACAWYEEALKSNSDNMDIILNLGDAYLELEDYPKAMKLYRKCANKGNAEAMNDIGLCYSYQGNYDSAILCFKNGAEAGDAWGYYYMAVLYEQGLGVEQNCVKAIDWYKKAAKGGVSDGYVSIGNLFQQNKGTYVKYPKEKYREWALQNYKLAADAGNEEGAEAYRKLVNK